MSEQLTNVSKSETQEYWKEVDLDEDLWKLVLMWSSYDFFMSIPEIAESLGICAKTIYNKLNVFKDKYPEAFKKLQEDRKSAKEYQTRINQGKHKEIPYEEWMNPHIQEKF